MYRSPKLFHSLLLCLYLAGLSYPAWAVSNSYQRALENAAALLPPGATVAAVIRDESGKTLFEHNSERLLTPASTVKLLTATAAYYQLGPHFRFNTELRQRANGDLVVRFSGDPYFDRSDLRRLLTEAKANGLGKEVNDVYLDSGVFNGHHWSDAQSWDNRNTCFAAPATAISLDRNCFKASVRAGKIGGTAEVATTAANPVAINSYARIVSPRERERLFCRLELRHQQRGLYGLHGCIVSGELPLSLKVAVVDPVHYAKATLRQEARELGITIKGDIRQRADNTSSRLLAAHQSEPLGFYLRHMLQRSDNQIADVLFKTTGGTHYSVPGNYRNGAAAVREILQDKANVSLDNSYLADGSGLSPHNQVTVTNVIDTLTHMAGMKDQSLVNSLAVSGVSGTLQHRSGLNRPPLRGNIRAKTGHLAGHYNLAGYLTDRSGRTLSFAVFVNGFSLSKPDSTGQSAPIRHLSAAPFFERLFNLLYEVNETVAAR